MRTTTRSEALSVGLDNWASLTGAERFAAARWAARRLHTTGEFRSLGSGVVGVGFGIRERRPEAKSGKPIYGKTPVLVVIVRRKWKNNVRATRVRAVPARVQIRVPLANRRILVAIPTDVCEVRQPRVHADRHACRAKSMKSGAQSVNGSVAALVRNVDQPEGPVYLLGCQHVIHRTLVTYNAAPDPTTEVYSHGPGADRLGMASRPAPFGPQVRSIDASLVRLHEGGFAIAGKGDFWRRIATDYIHDEAGLEVVSTLGWKLFSRFEPTGLKYVRTLFDEPIKYGSNDVTIRIAEVVVSRSIERVPQSGDSGGAVMAGPVLVGVHIAGRGPLSYCIPAYRLFSSTAFDPKLKLASDLIQG